MVHTLHPRFGSHTSLIPALERWDRSNMAGEKKEYKGEEIGSHWSVESEDLCRQDLALLIWKFARGKRSLQQLVTLPFWYSGRTPISVSWVLLFMQPSTNNKVNWKCCLGSTSHFWNIPAVKSSKRQSFNWSFL